MMHRELKMAATAVVLIVLLFSSGCGTNQKAEVKADGGVASESILVGKQEQTITVPSGGEVKLTTVGVGKVSVEVRGSSEARVESTK
jgi:hypothetical protein